MRTLEDLRVARDRLNQNASNSSRPPGSMPPWQRGEATAPSSDMPSEPDRQDGDDDDTGADTSTKPKPPKKSANKDTPEAGANDATAQASASAQAANKSTPRRAGRSVGDPGHGRTQKLAPTHFVHKHPTHCAACQHPFTQDGPAQAWTAWDTLELQPISGLLQDTVPLRLGLHIEVTRYTLMQHHCACGHTTRATAQHNKGRDLWEGVDIGEQRLLGPRLASAVVYLSQRMRLPRRKPPVSD
jgi:hypothetical protein